MPSFAGSFKIALSTLGSEFGAIIPLQQTCVNSPIYCADLISEPAVVMGPTQFRMRTHHTHTGSVHQQDQSGFACKGLGKHILK